MAARPVFSTPLLAYLRSAAIGGPFKSQCRQLHNLHLKHDVHSRAGRLQTSFPRSSRRTITTSRACLRPQTSNPADDPNWISLVDVPQQLVRIRTRHSILGLLVLAAIPVTAFCLGTWQVQRLKWKNDLIARFEDRLVRPPLPLPPTIDPERVKEFDYRRVYAYGRWRHDQEILVGPRVHDGAPGFLVTTPLEREGEEGGGSKILVARGWIPKDRESQAVRRKISDEALPEGRVMIEGLLREPFKQNMFTPANVPEKGQWYFPDVGEMASHTGSSPVWVEQTMQADLLTAWDREAKGVPIGRAAEVNLRNNHTQYIFTW